MEIKRREKGSQVDFATGRMLRGKMGKKGLETMLCKRQEKTREVLTWKMSIRKKSGTKKCNKYLSSLYSSPNFKLLVYTFSTLGCRHSNNTTSNILIIKNAWVGNFTRLKISRPSANIHTLFAKSKGNTPSISLKRYKGHCSNVIDTAFIQRCHSPTAIKWTLPKNLSCKNKTTLFPLSHVE